LWKSAEYKAQEATSVMMNKSTLLRLSLSLVAAAMLACSGQQIATPNPATAVPESPTSTPESPTATPELPTPTAKPEPTRIQFGAGATSVTVIGSIERTEQSGVEYDEGYVVRALGGQTMEVIITSPNHDVLLTIVGADGIPLKRYVDGMAEWRGVLPATQDYFIKPVSVGQETVYTLTVTISALD